MECPGTEMFQLLFGGQLTPEQQGPLADHAATCPACHAMVEAMVTQHGPAHPEPRPLTVGSNSSQRRRAPRWQLAAAVLAGAVAVLAIAITIRGLVHRGDDVAVAPGTTASGSAASPAPAGSAAPPAGAPAVVPPSSPTGPLSPPPAASIPDAGVAPAAPGPAPHEAAPPRGSTGPLSSFAAEQQRCDATLDRARAAALGTTLPSQIVKCWCQSHDPGHARTAFALLAGAHAHDRDTVRRFCKSLHVDL
ncbi:MAG TPA: hypothetical protein VHT91_31950 [Kofleriaceae bacterium]|nr:hypothetical protein [Kofleriaceae bacterium]